MTATKKTILAMLMLFLVSGAFGLSSMRKSYEERELEKLPEVNERWNYSVGKWCVMVQKHSEFPEVCAADRTEAELQALKEANR